MGVLAHDRVGQADPPANRPDRPRPQQARTRDVVPPRSGPLGGDLQIGALIADGGVDLLVFFWDPLEAQPHDPDVKALLRMAVVWNVPVANNVATADLLLLSPLMSGEYVPDLPDHSGYVNRNLPTP